MLKQSTLSLLFPPSGDNQQVLHSGRGCMKMLLSIRWKNCPVQEARTEKESEKGRQETKLNHSRAEIRLHTHCRFGNVTNLWLLENQESLQR